MIMDRNHQRLRVIRSFSIFTSPQSFDEKSDPAPESHKPHADCNILYLKRAIGKACLAMFTGIDCILAVGNG